MFGTRTLVLAGVFAGLAIGADIDSVALLNRVRSKIRENAATIPRFVCRQELFRWDYASESKPKSCREIGADETKNPRLKIQTSDRAALDVMLTSKSELYTWPGTQSFSAETPTVLLGGGFSGSGDFAGFVTSVFTIASAVIEYRGPCENSGCVRYRFDMPQAVSKYTLRTSRSEVALGYHGTFDINPETADLLSLTVIPTDIHQVPGACDLRTRMTYARVPIAAGIYTIPESTEKLYLAADGSLFRNRASYKGCREYTAESAISFGDEDTAQADAAPTPVLPASGTRLDLTLVSKIDSKTAMAGDAVEARLAREVRDKEGHVLPANTVFRGHIAQMEHIYASPPTVTSARANGSSVLLALHLDSLVLNGVTMNTRVDPAGIADGNGNQIYHFMGTNFVLDSRFVSKWIFGGVVK